MSDQEVPFDIGAEPATIAPAGFPPPAAEEPSPPAAEELSPPGAEDLSGWRIAAALIDLIVLAGVAVMLSAATGQISSSSTSFQITLNAGWTLVLVAIALLYYFVLEAWAGQTVGKLLFDLRVRTATGEKPSIGAVALRTLLRIVDWLPVLYLAGFISMLATGARRQRIGDLAAKTAMARAGRPARDRGLALLPLAAVVVAAIVVAALRANSAGGTQTYQGHGVSFEYPAGWSSGVPQGGATTGNLLWATSVAPGPAEGGVIVQGYRLKVPVTAQNIAAVVPGLARLLQRLGATLHGTPQKATMAGLPGVQFHVSSDSGGTPSQGTLVFAFNGTTEYFVSCQYPPGFAANVQQACNQVVSTFRVSGGVVADPAGGGQDGPRWHHPQVTL
jgi:uncharacterized RDD family membrane protein YckC